MPEVQLEFVMDAGRLPSDGDVKAPAEDSGPTIVTTNSRCTPMPGELGVHLGTPAEATVRGELCESPAPPRFLKSASLRGTLPT